MTNSASKKHAYISPYRCRFALPRFALHANVKFVAERMLETWLNTNFAGTVYLYNPHKIALQVKHLRAFLKACKAIME